MSGFWAVLRKELRTYFVSPVFYTFVAAFLVLMGGFFYLYIDFFVDAYLQSQRNPFSGGISINDFLRDSSFQNMVIFIIILTPLLTMRLFAAEFKQKSDELLFTAPVATGGVLLAKFAGTLVVMLIAFGATLFVPAAAEYISNVDWMPVWMAYLGWLGLGAAAASLGIFVSSLTEDQLIAFIVSFVLLITILILGYFAPLFDAQWAKSFVEYATFQAHFDRMAKGILDLRDVVYFVSFVALFLFLAHRVLASRQWRTQMAQKEPGKRWILGLAGVMLVLAYLVLRIILPLGPEGTPAWMMAFWVTGFALLAAWIAWDWDALWERAKSRSFLFSSQASIQVIAVIAIVIGTNYLAARRHVRWDLTQANLYSLAEQSITVAASLDRPVEIVAFVPEMDPQRERIRSLLELYQEHNNEISVRVIDARANPVAARKYEIDAPVSVVFSMGDRQTRINYEITEQEVTNALIKLKRTQTQKICFTTGHGEPGIAEEAVNGFSFAADALRKQGYEVSEVNVLDEGALKGCAIVAVTSPTQVPFEPELERLDAFMLAGGRLLALIDPEPGAGMTDWLAKYGVAVGEGIVIDPTFDGLVAVGVPSQAHPATQKITAGVLLPAVRPVEPAKELPEGAGVERILSTRENTWVEKALPEEEGGQVAYDAGTDRLGPIPVGVAGELAVEESEEEDAGTEGEDAPMEQGRLVVIGDANFASNAVFYANVANGDLFLNLVAWLADQPDLISIPPREQDVGEFNVPSESFMTAVVVLPTLVVPAGLIVLGVGIWTRRRRS